MEFLYAFLPVLVGILLPVLIGLLVLMFAARVVTRIVLDEIRKDRGRRGPI
jgi:uncharacterized integral membrane protein